MKSIPTPVKLAVFFEHELSIGGNYQQSLNNILAINTISNEIASIFIVTTIEKNAAMLASYGIKSVFLRLNKLTFIWLRIRNLISTMVGKNIISLFWKYNYLERFLKKNNIDLVYFTSQSPLAPYLDLTNYIFTLFDLCHRDYPEFPEVRASGSFEKRELFFQKSLSKAIAVFVESDFGKINVIRRYGLDEDRVYINPLVPSINSSIKEVDYMNNYIDIKLKYELNHDYIFYPAQFWSHKNHIYLLCGVKELELRYGLIIDIIFSGGDQGNLSYVKEFSNKIGLLDRTYFVGFVPNHEMPYLYKQSIALVMPTYFGPTNLPILEAFKLGVPVIYSNLAGLREQAGGAALLMNLDNPSHLADLLLSLINDVNLRELLIRKGFLRLAELSENNTSDNVATVLKKFSSCRICWR
jgi:glycosyltransferase involved in cell wall biosynthesis